VWWSWWGYLFSSERGSWLVGFFWWTPMCLEDHYGGAEGWNSFLPEACSLFARKDEVCFYSGEGALPTAPISGRRRMGPRAGMIYLVPCWELCPDPHLRHRPLHSLHALCRWITYFSRAKSYTGLSIACYPPLPSISLLQNPGPLSFLISALSQRELHFPNLLLYAGG